MTLDDFTMQFLHENRGRLLREEYTGVTTVDTHPRDYVENGVVFHWLSDDCVIQHLVTTVCNECEGWESES